MTRNHKETHINIVRRSRMLATHPAMFLLLPLLLHVLLVSDGPSLVVCAAADAELRYTVVEMSTLKAGAACLGHRVSPPANVSWVPLDLPHGPCSSSSDESNGAAAGGVQPPSLADLLRQDQVRADDVQQRLRSPNSSYGESKGVEAPISGETDVSYQARIHVPLGTRKRRRATTTRNEEVSSIDPSATGDLLPGVIQTVVLDTASDVAWVQCVPCPVPPCHPQTDTFYDPTNSGTYAAFPCNSPACRQLGRYANGCVNGQCQYRVVYPDGSTTSGTYSSDLLTLNPTTRVSSFQFGCSHVAQGNFGTQTAGIMALGGGPESLASQTAATYGSVFAYCLPPTASYLGFFVLGAPRVAASRFVVTPMLRDPRVPTFYRVLLRGIVVAGRRLNVAPAVFAAGSVLDSRTAITRLPPTAYQALRAAFRSSMSAYRMAPPRGILDTCYDFTGVSSVRVPTVALVFDPNAAVELDPSGILLNGCLAFAANADDRMAGILGNVQQQTIEVVYDVGGGAVGFRRNAC